MQSIASENPLNDVRGYEPERRPSETLSVGILARLIVWEDKDSGPQTKRVLQAFSGAGFPDSGLRHKIIDTPIQLSASISVSASGPKSKITATL